MKPNETRYGPIRRSLLTHDFALLYETVRERCDIDPEDPDSCWRVRTSLVGAGYAYIGRAGTRQFLHRVMAFAADGFPGELRAYPSVHHLCGVRRCVRPEHLSKATDLLNTIESRARTALLDRIRALQEALREVQPDHSLLLDGWGTSSNSLPGRLNTAASHETPAERVKRRRRRQDWDDRLKSIERRRFKQVLDYQRLRASGLSSTEALGRVDLTRSTASDWSIRLAAWMASEEL